MGDALEARQTSDRLFEELARRLRDVGMVADEDLRGWADSAVVERVGETERALRRHGYEGGALGTHRYPRGEADWISILYDTGRFVTPRDAELEQELAWRRDRHTDVSKRADEWIDRLASLRETVSGWVAASAIPGLRLDDRRAVPMSEDIMRCFGVAARAMPSFLIRKNNDQVLRFQPRGLWTIGANGRVDLITGTSTPMLVDMSAPLSESPDWRLLCPGAPLPGRPFSKETFIDLLDQSPNA